LLSCVTCAWIVLSFNLQIILRDSVSCGVFKDVNKQRHEAATTKKDKAMKKTILLAVAVAGVFTLAVSAQAGEPLLSPRAQEQEYSLRTVPTVASDVNLAVNRPSGNGIQLLDKSETERGGADWLYRAHQHSAVGAASKRG